MIGVASGDPLLSLWVRRHLLSLLGIPPEEGAAAIDGYTGDEMPQHRLLAKIREQPLFAKKRVLWVTRADQSSEIDPSGILEKNRKTVTTVILEAPEKSLSAWSKTIPAFSLSPPTKPADREAWIRFLAEKHRLVLDKGAMDPLMTTFEGALGPVDRLFADLSANGEPQRVTEELLEKQGVVTHYKTVFELLRGLESGDRKFFREWERFLDGGQSPFGLLSLLHRQWKLYRIARNVLEEQRGSGEAEKMVAALGGVPSFVAGGIVRIAAKMSRESMRKGSDALWEADLLLKSGVSTGLVMDRLAATLYTLGQEHRGKEEGRRESTRKVLKRY